MTSAGRHSIVFVHLGGELPAWAFASLAQATVFNACPILMLADAAALFGWRYARREVRDASAQVSPLAASVSSIAGAHLLPSPP